MLKGTHQPSPLPPGWSEHKTPTGHTYYYNVETKTSTYQRPVAALPRFLENELAVNRSQPVPRAALDLSNPTIANAFMEQYGPRPSAPVTATCGGFAPRPRPQPVDRPKSKALIPGCEPWILVYTKYGRRFAHNPIKKASFWRIPDKLKLGILELDQRNVREKAGVRDEGRAQATQTSVERGKSDAEGGRDGGDDILDDSEYEEVEVTDDDDDQGHAPKRQRNEEACPDGPRGPLEFTEADMAAQLAAMGEDASGNDDDAYQEPAAPSEEDASALFRDLLDDHAINPYSSWETVLEASTMVDDSRYTALATTRARKAVWESWSRDRIAALKMARAAQVPQDPLVAYLALLQERATPRLYWAEFRRKHRRDSAMRDPNLLDRERERLYREHVARLKMPAATLKSDLKRLLESAMPAATAEWNTQTAAGVCLPPSILRDVRFISLEPKVRDALVEAYMQGLGPPPREAQDSK